MNRLDLRYRFWLRATELAGWLPGRIGKAVTDRCLARAFDALIAVHDAEEAS